MQAESSVRYGRVTAHWVIAIGAVISAVAIRAHRAEVVTALPASQDHPCQATAS
ncbi:MAG: hypothetical protein ACRDJS_01280 [Actinomycetota bacterium]